MKENKSQILNYIKRTGEKGISYRELLRKLRVKPKQQQQLSEQLEELQKAGEIVQRKGKLFTAKRAGLHEAVIDRIHKLSVLHAKQIMNRKFLFPEIFKGSITGGYRSNPLYSISKRRRSGRRGCKCFVIRQRGVFRRDGNF